MTIDPQREFYSALAEATGYDFELMELARQRTQSLFNVQVKSAYDPNLRESGWKAVGGSGNETVQGYTREQMNELARHYHRNDPLVTNGINLHNVYTFGRGVSPVATDPTIQKTILDFWDEPTNRAVLSTMKAQQKLNTDRLLDGELFFMLYVSTATGLTRIRQLSPGEITGIIYADNDPTRPAYYKREYETAEYDFKADKYKKPKKIKCFIPDYRNSRPDHNLYQKAMGITPESQTLVYIYHLCSNEFEGRGLSHIATAMAWVKAFKGFMEDRVTLQMALALFAFKTTIKGNQNAIDRTMSRWNAYEQGTAKYGTGEQRERRLGSTNWFQNEAMNMEQFSVDTGASNAETDGRMLIRMIGIGMGWHEGYISGNNETGSWASMNAMELPMLKNCEAEQQLWSDVLGDLFSFVIYMKSLYSQDLKDLVIVDDDPNLKIWRIRGKGETDVSATVRFPEIVAKDVGIWLGAIAQIKQTEVMTGVQYIPDKETRIVVMNALGYDDAVSIAEQMEGETYTPPANEAPAAESVKGGYVGDEALAKILNEFRQSRPAPYIIPYSTNPGGKNITLAPEISNLTPAQIADVIYERLVSRAGVGRPLTDEKAKAMEEITKDEIEDTLDEFKDMPPFDELLDELGISEDEVDDA